MSDGWIECEQGGNGQARMCQRARRWHRDPLPEKYDANPPVTAKRGENVGPGSNDVAEYFGDSPEAE
jgi:hypothetical protein